MLPFSIQQIDARRHGFEDALADLRRRLSPEGDVVSPRGRELTLKVFGEPLTPEQVVQRICGDVRKLGTPALLRYSHALDANAMEASELRVPADRLSEAHRGAAPEFLASVRRIRDNIHAFQSAILHQSVRVTPSPGVCLEQRYVPLKRVGICVPGGAAAYPSTVLMTVVPALAAGVEQIAIVAPPTPYGAYNEDVLSVCHELGVTEVYALGGAHAVAAMAYGVPEIPAVDKIVGPGNLFVALAKRHVYGQVDIDSIAGPSEVVVIADDSAPPAFVAADLLAQAEHSPGASILICWDEAVQERIAAAVRAQVQSLERSQLTIESLSAFGALVLARDAEHACELTDLIAPEHLQISTREPRALHERIRNAGATFLGRYSPVALGDYAAGPSHVLPTGGTARWASGLSANDFLRSGSVIEYDRDALQDIAQDIQRLAQCEGLTAHARSIQIRNEELDESHARQR